MYLPLLPVWPLLLEVSSSRLELYEVEVWYHNLSADRVLGKSSGHTCINSTFGVRREEGAQDWWTQSRKVTFHLWV